MTLLLNFLISVGVQSAGEETFFFWRNLVRDSVWAWLVSFEANPFLCYPLIIWRVVSIVSSAIGDKYVYDWNLFSLSNTWLRYCRPLTTYPPDISSIVRHKFIRNVKLVIFFLQILVVFSAHMRSHYTHYIFWKIIAVHCLEIWFLFNKK